MSETVNYVIVDLDTSDGNKWLGVAAKAGAKHARIYLTRANIYYDLTAVEIDGKNIVKIYKNKIERKIVHYEDAAVTNKTSSELDDIAYSYPGIDKVYSVCNNDCENFCQYFLLKCLK